MIEILSNIWEYHCVHDIWGLMRRVFATGSGDPGSILGRVIPKNQKMVLDAALFITEDYETDCISHSTNTLGKGMNPIILPTAVDK